jgi:hypothetical protein
VLTVKATATPGGGIEVQIDKDQGDCTRGAFLMALAAVSMAAKAAYLELGRSLGIPEEVLDLEKQGHSMAPMPPDEERKGGTDPSMN